MANVNDHFFDGIYKEIWKSMIPDLLTQREIDFILSYFDLQPGDKILDLMCGYGRHALALARKKMQVTAVDNLQVYIEEIGGWTEEESLAVTAVCEDVISFSSTPTHVLAICMGNSLNFYNEEDLKQVLTNVNHSLSPGGSLLINTWSLAEIAWPSFREESSGMINGIECKTRSRRYSEPSRIESVTSFTRPDGKTEEKLAVDFIYSVPEITAHLEATGFKLRENFSIPGKKHFSEGDPRAYLVAKKIN